MGVRVGVLAALIGVGAAVSGCIGPGETGPAAVSPRVTEVQPAPQLDPRFDGQTVGFADLPGWSRGRHLAVLAAVAESCEAFIPTDPRNDAAASPGDQAWIGACRRVMGPAGGADNAHGQGAGAPKTQDQARALIEHAFRPVLLSSPDGDLGRVTAYYEPTIAVRARPTGPFTEPILRRPVDLLVQRKTLANGNRVEEIFQISPDGGLSLYPDREQIVANAEPGQIIAYGRLSDVLFLQIQGSGRLEFEGGRVVRAAFDQTNGLGYVSVPKLMMERGILPRGGASNAAVKAWLNQADPDVAKRLVNANPRYVFFRDEPVGDVGLGPVGNAGYALWPGVSVAVDPAWHDYGALYWIAPEGQGAPRPQYGLAHDKGAAIKGPLRADLFFGSGDRAGAMAARVYHEAEWWALVPRTAE